MMEKIKQHNMGIFIAGIIIGIVFISGMIEINLLWIVVLGFSILLLCEIYFRFNRISYATIPPSYESIQTIPWEEIECFQKKLSNTDFQQILKSLSDETYLSFCEYLQKTDLNQIQTDYIMNVTIRKQINYKIHQRQMLKMIKESLFGMI